MARKPWRNFVLLSVLNRQKACVVASQNAIAYIAGVVLAAVAVDYFNVAVAIVIVGVILLATMFSYFADRSWIGCAIAATWVALGCLAYSASFQVHHQRFGYLQDQPVEITGTISTPLAQKDTNFYFLLAVNQYIDGGHVQGRIRVTIDTWAWSTDERQAVAALSYGDEVVVSGWLRKPSRASNPGEPNWQSYAYRSGYSATLYVEDPKQLQATGGNNARFPMKQLYALHQDIKSLEKDLPDDVVPFYRSLLLGDRSLFTVKQQEAIERAGVSHLLSISGTHIGLLVGVYCIVGSVFRKPRWQSTLMALPLLYVYLLLTGLQASTLRAVVGLTLGVSAAISKRPKSSLQLLILTAWVTLIINPLNVTGVGWQLSFAAVFGILALSPVFGKMLFPMPNWLFSSVAVSLGAWVGVTPLALYYFQTASLNAIVANLVLIPLFGLLLIIIFLLGAIGLVTPGWISMGGALANYVVSLFWLLVDWFAAFPGFFQVPGFSWVYPTLFYAWLIVCYPLLQETSKLPRFLSRQSRKRLLNWTMGFLAVAFWFSIFSIRPGEIEVVFLDVGQGDAIYISLPGDYHIMIDAGGRPILPDRRPYDVGKEIILPFLRYKDVRRLDLVVITHPHVDHYGGFASVVEAIDVGMIWYNGQTASDPSFRRLWSLIEERKVPCYTVSTGDWLEVGDTHLKVLHPPRSVVANNLLGTNDASLVTMLEGNDTRFLFTGDVEIKGQRMLLADGQELDSFAMKAPHHGSTLAFDVFFNQAVNPQISVVQVGRNGFGQPGEQVLNSLKRQGVQVFRTDEDGAVIVHLWFGRRLVRTQKSRLFLRY